MIKGLEQNQSCWFSLVIFPLKIASLPFSYRGSLFADNHADIYDSVVPSRWAKPLWWETQGLFLLLWTPLTLLVCWASHFICDFFFNFYVFLQRWEVSRASSSLASLLNHMMLYSTMYMFVYFIEFWTSWSLGPHQYICTCYYICTCTLHNAREIVCGHYVFDK